MERPLFWHQGLFLQPQHFQIEDRYSQSLGTPLYRFLQPHLWGLGGLEATDVVAGNAVEKPFQAQLLFQDMTYVVYPDTAVMEARPFQEDWVEGGRPFTVYIGIKKWQPAGGNVTVLEKFENLSAVTTRFVSLADPEEVEDLHQSGPAAQVKRLYYVLKFFWETEIDQLGDYLLVPYARLERTGEAVGLSERFIPPALSVDASEILYRIVKEIRDQIASRGRQLEFYKRDRGIHTAEFGARDMVYLLALRSLNRYGPILSHMLESGRVHPWTVYGILRQLIGELSSFSEEVNSMGELADGAPLLSGYDHEDLWTCFSGAEALVTRLLDEITAGPEYMIPLVYDGTYFAAELPPQIFEGRNRFYLVFGTEADPAEVIKAMGVVAKLSSREALPILIARALPGIRLEPLSTPPQELPRRAHSIYFQVDHHSDKWAQVSSGRNLALYWEGAPDDLQVELMVVGRH
jgi:type VI secretion system protein ImpJ